MQNADSTPDEGSAGKTRAKWQHPAAAHSTYQVHQGLNFDPFDFGDCFSPDSKESPAKDSGRDAKLCSAVIMQGPSAGSTSRASPINAASPAASAGPGAAAKDSDSKVPLRRARTDRSPTGSLSPRGGRLINRPLLGQQRRVSETPGYGVEELHSRGLLGLRGGGVGGGVGEKDLTRSRSPSAITWSTAPTVPRTLSPSPALTSAAPQTSPSPKSVPHLWAPAVDLKGHAHEASAPSGMSHVSQAQLGEEGRRAPRDALSRSLKLPSDACPVRVYPEGLSHYHSPRESPRSPPPAAGSRWDDEVRAARVQQCGSAPLSLAPALDGRRALDVLPITRPASARDIKVTGRVPSQASTASTACTASRASAAPTLPVSMQASEKMFPEHMHQSPSAGLGRNAFMSPCQTRNCSTDSSPLDARAPHVPIPPTMYSNNAAGVLLPRSPDSTWSSPTSSVNATTAFWPDTGPVRLSSAAYASTTEKKDTIEIYDAARKLIEKSLPQSDRTATEALNLLQSLKSTLLQASVPIGSNKHLSTELAYSDAMPEDQQEARELMKMAAEKWMDFSPGGSVSQGGGGGGGGGDVASKGKKRMEIVSHMMTLAEKTRLKDEAKQRLIDAELARCTFAPTISTRSKEMAASRARASASASKDDSRPPRHAQLTTNARNKLEPPASSVTPLHQVLQKAQSRVSQSIVKQLIRDGKRKGPIEERLLQAAQRRKEKMAEAEGAKLEQVERDMASSRATLALDLSIASAVAGAPGVKTALAKRAMATSHRLFSLSSGMPVSVGFICSLTGLF
jgi:hypothetical protein